MIALGHNGKAYILKGSDYMTDEERKSLEKRVRNVLNKLNEEESRKERNSKPRDCLCGGSSNKEIDELLEECSKTSKFFDEFSEEEMPEVGKIMYNIMLNEP